MARTCEHLDQIQVAVPEQVEGGEDWSWCYVDEVAVVPPDTPRPV